MSGKQHFQISLTFDFAELAMHKDWIDADKVEAWISAAKESGKEFSNDLGEFLSKHPFVKSFKIEEK